MVAWVFRAADGDGACVLQPLRLKPVTAQPGIAAWNEWVQRYHPLGYRRSGLAPLYLVR